MHNKIFSRIEVKTIKEYKIIKEYETNRIKEKYIGKIFKSNGYGDFKILEVCGKAKDNSAILLCEFANTGFKTTASGTNIVKGRLKDLYLPKVFGIGFIGDYHENINAKINKCYNDWIHILEQCYSKRSLINNKTYVGCEVDKKMA